MSTYQRLFAALQHVTPENLDEAQRDVFPQLVGGDLTEGERERLLKVLAERTGVSLRTLKRDLRDTAKANPEREATGYQVIDGALYYMKDTQNGPQPVPLANFTATIMREEVRDDGLEQTRHFVITGQLADGRPLPTAEVPAVRFASMAWVPEYWGTQAIVHAGFGTKDHLRVAIQARSGDAPLHTVYEHFGWRKLPDGWAYLHAGGAITADGNAEDVEVQPPDPGLRRYELPDPPAGDELRASVRASLRLLKLGPYRLTAPLLAATYRAPLAEVVPADFSIALTGPTGAFKTEMVAAFQAHYGPAFDGRNLPAAWTDTENAIERKAFVAKDALFPVDDFNPSGSTTDQARAHRTFERVGRAQGNQAGRSRLRSDTSFRPSYHPRGVIVSTGEEAPRGHSLRARIFNIDVTGRTPNGAAGDVTPDALTRAQQDAYAGHFAQAMSGYLQWLAPQVDTLREELRTVRADLRVATRTKGHARTPEQVADLALGLAMLLRYAHHVGAITTEELHQAWWYGWEALEAAAARQAAHQAQEDPARRFIELLTSALATGGAHLADTNGDRPTNAGQWGWQRRDSAGGDDWQPRGDQIGWLDGDEVLLEPDAAYATAQGRAQRQGTNIPVTQRTLFKRVDERGLLTGADPNRTTVKRTVAGARRRVLVLQSSSLLPTEAGQSGRDSENADSDDIDGAPNPEITGAPAGHPPPFPGHPPTARPDSESARPDPKRETGRKNPTQTPSHTARAPSAPNAPVSQGDPPKLHEPLSDAAAREAAELRDLTPDELHQHATASTNGEPNWWTSKARTAPLMIATARQLVRKHHAPPGDALTAARTVAGDTPATSPEVRP